MDSADTPAPRRRISWRSFAAGAFGTALVAAAVAVTAATVGAVEVAVDASERDRLTAQVRETSEALARAEASRGRAVLDAARMEAERNAARGELAAVMAERDRLAAAATTSACLDLMYGIALDISQSTGVPMDETAGCIRSEWAPAALMTYGNQVSELEQAILELAAEVQRYRGGSVVAACTAAGIGVATDGGVFTGALLDACIDRITGALLGP